MGIVEGRGQVHVDGNLCYLWASSGNSGENSSWLELVLQKEVRLSLGLSGGVVYLVLGEVRGRGMGWPRGRCGTKSRERDYSYG